MNPEYLANKARKAISEYCIKDCKAYCCRKGYLVLTAKQMTLVVKNKQLDFEKRQILQKLENNQYSLYMGYPEKPCPSLNIDFTCSIHKNKGRSKTCRQFPIFIEGKNVKISQRCLAVRNGLIYPYISQFLKMGFKLIETSLHSEQECFNNNFTRLDPTINKKISNNKKEKEKSIIAKITA